MKIIPKDRHKFLRRYTTLPVVLEMLSGKVLMLTDPAKWEDKNDSFTIDRYKERNGLKSVLAACFTGTKETFHHWKVFGSGAAGVCVVFRRNALEAALEEQKDVRTGLTKYRTLDDIRQKKAVDQDLPFLKRIGYQDELEYRVIWTSKAESRETFGLPIPLSCIDKLVVNPWLPQSLAETIRAFLKKEAGTHSGNHEITIERSYLVESTTWKNAVTKRFPRPASPTAAG